MALAPLQPVSKPGTVILRDNFEGSALNQEEWEHEVSMNGGYNWEFQVYTNDPLNVFQRGGKLYLKPTLTCDSFGEEFLTNGKMDVREIWGTCTNSDRDGCVREGKNGLLPPIMSGKVKSKKTIKFGRIDVRAKIPKGDWIWPAIWLLPRSYSYGGWPASGEIDMMESRGNLRAMGGTKNHGNCEVCSTVHLGPEPSQHRYQGTQGAKYDPTPGWSQEFHTYTLDWDADRIICSVDGVPVMTVPTPAEGFWNYGPPFSGSNPWVNGGKSAPYDEPFYLILNVAVGGTNNFFPDDWSYNTPKPWRNNSTTANADFWKKT